MRAPLARRRTLSAIAGLALVGAGLGTGTATLASAAVVKSGNGSDRPGHAQPVLRAIGTVNLGALARAQAATKAPAPATLNLRTEIPPRLLHESDQGDAVSVPQRAPGPAPLAVSGSTPGAMAFEGLTARDSRYANGGNQFTSEPPDQALCVGNGYAMEGVNTAVAVYDHHGAQLAPTLAISQLLGLPAEYNRTKGTFGPSSFDPVCLYDSQVKRWFFLVTELDQDPTSGALTGRSHIYFVVSQSGNPLGDYTRYAIRTDRGDSTDRRCPCFDDFPHIGSDANGFYITANRFPVFDAGYDGAQLYAISKTQLAANARGRAAMPALWSRNVGAIAGEPSYTVQPAAVPTGGVYPNREYFLTTLGEGKAGQKDRIGIFALSHTKSLDNRNIRVKLTHNTVRSRVYAPEPNAEQKVGPAPLANLANEPLNKLDTGSAMSEVEYSRGRLWAATGTAVKDADPKTNIKRDGVLWFQVAPQMVKGRIDGSMVHQGYVAVATNDVFYPAIGVNAAGQGAMVMSMSGPTVYPSPAYVRMDMTGASGPVRVPNFGKRPDDGFTCYAAFVGSRDRGCRWGDYSAATADSTGKVWMATEWISGSARLPFANWSTEVIRYLP